MKKPRVRFCWHCGKQLYGNHHSVLFIQEYDRILHKQCAKEIRKKSIYDYDFKVDEK